VGGRIVSATNEFDLGVDAYASKLLVAEADESLDPCGCQVSGVYGHSQGVAVPRPLRGSAAIDWLANRNPLTVTSWDDPVVAAAGHHVRSIYVEQPLPPMSIAPTAGITARPRDTRLVAPRWGADGALMKLPTGSAAVVGASRASSTESGGVL
jgi:hypothetical protein